MRKIFALAVFSVLILSTFAVAVAAQQQETGFSKLLSLIWSKITGGSVTGNAILPPVANDDFAAGHMNTLVGTLVGGQTSVLWNDEGEALQIISWTQPVDSVTGLPVGTLVFNGADGTFLYIPEPGYVGTAKFDYEINDTVSGIVDDATVTITMTNALPVASNGAASGHMNIPLGGSVVFGDTPDVPGGEIDPLTVVVTFYPSHGTVVFDPVAKTFTYTPDPLDPGYVGIDTFTYSVSDGQQRAAPDEGTVTITLTNALPEANPASYNTSMNTPLTAMLLSYYDTPDFNGEIDPLAVSLIGGGSTSMGGSVTLNPDGSFVYTPLSDWVGTDSFVYYVSDGQQGAEPAIGTVTIEVISLESCKSEKTSQLGILSSITLTNKDDMNRLKEAVKALNKSLNEQKKLKWKAECELYCPYEVSPKANSKKVFYDEEKAVKKLMEIRDWAKNVQINSSIVKITDVDKLLAQKALDANPACNTLKATTEMTAAMSDYNAKKYKEAIHHYKKVWELSTQCLCKEIKYNVTCNNYLETAWTLLGQNKLTEATTYENKFYACSGLSP